MIIRHLNSYAPVRACILYLYDALRACERMHASLCMRSRACVCRPICVCAYVRACVCACVRACVRACVCVCVRLFICLGSVFKKAMVRSLQY